MISINCILYMFVAVTEDCLSYIVLTYVSQISGQEGGPPYNTTVAE